MCKSQGLFLNSSSDVIKNKAIALIKYQEVSSAFIINRLYLTHQFLQNPESATGSKVACEMSSSTGISIAALLDRASEDKSTAEKQTEVEREKAQLVSLFHLSRSHINSS
jgi:hypothetical protein